MKEVDMIQGVVAMLETWVAKHQGVAGQKETATAKAPAGKIDDLSGNIAAMRKT